MTIASNQPTTKDKREAFLRVVLLISVAILTMLAIALPIFIESNTFALKAGDVSPKAFVAPYAHAYKSEVLTSDAIEKAKQSIQPIYLPSDPSISRSQLDKLRITLSYISEVRVDTYASMEQKLNDLSNLADSPLEADSAQTVLELSDTRWETIQQESLSVLEQVMRNTIRDTQVSEARRSVVSLVSFSLTTEQSELVNGIVSPFIIPNSLYSEELTDAARQKAAETIEPINRSFSSGELIVQRGQIIIASNGRISQTIRYYPSEPNYEQLDCNFGNHFHCRWVYRRLFYETPIKDKFKYYQSFSYIHFLPGIPLCWKAAHSRTYRAALYFSPGSFWTHHCRSLYLRIGIGFYTHSCNNHSLWNAIQP